MTDFIRNIWHNANTAAAAAATSNVANPVIKTELVRPVNQIQIPVTPAAITSPDAVVEKQRLIKVEVPEPLTRPMATTMTTSAATTSDAGKAQRAVRRDVVNARRDKRKAMAAASSTATSTDNGDSDDENDDENDEDDEEDDSDKSKKMKTGKTSSLAVVGGLAGSETKKSSVMSIVTPGLLFTPEIDAAGEERIRAMEAQLESLDPDSKEAKKKRRLIRNRMSAQLHRERKKAYVGQLEDQLMDKDRELKLLQEKLAKMMDESEKLKKQLSESEKETQARLAAATATAAAAAAAKAKAEAMAVSAATAPSAMTMSTARPSLPSTPATVTNRVLQVTSPLVKVPAKKTMEEVEEVVIKEEPMSWDAPWPMDAAETWDFNGLEDTEMADIETDDLLRDFDYPFAGLDEYPDFTKPHAEIHAAKKNVAMMMAVMFSVGFFGNNSSFFNMTAGSNFSSMFNANPPKEFSQMSIASRIVACLEKTSWKDFRDISSWISEQTATSSDDVVDAADVPVVGAVASPSAASDVTDGSCDSPAPIDDCLASADLIDGFVYPVDDPFASSTLPEASWLDAEDMQDVEMDKLADKEDKIVENLSMHLSEEALSKKSEKSSSMTSRLYDTLTKLWKEKNQVLLTVLNSKQEVTQRSVVDMSLIQEGLQSGDFFTKVFGAEAATTGTSVQDDQSVTFLYPMSAFAPTGERVNAPLHGGDVSLGRADPMFLEVSCQMNSGPSAVAMQM